MKACLFAASIGLSLLMPHATTAAEITAFVTGAARNAFDTLAPQFERTTGHRLATPFELPPTLIKKIDAGEPFDVIVLSYDVEGLIKQGKVVADSRAVLGRVGVVVAVRQGAPKPDFSTVDAFKRSLLAAKTSPYRARGAAAATSLR
jgi:molybdate transport system substrate-binding protein